MGLGVKDSNGSINETHKAYGVGQIRLEQGREWFSEQTSVVINRTFAVRCAGKETRFWNSGKGFGIAKEFM